MAYTTVEELEAGWRTLTDSEARQAEVLIERASLYLDEVVSRYRIDAVEKRAALGVVCCDLVQRKMESLSANPLSAVTQTAGAFSETKSYAKPYRKSWELYPEDLAYLGVYRGTGRVIQVAVHGPGGEIL